MVVWTCIQAATGITAACLAHLRPLFNVAQRRFKDRLHRQETAQSSKELLDKGFSSESTTYELYHTQHSNV
jgi:SOS response regulatory protein OraA/RecX